MSIVGTRPLLIREVSKYELHHRARLAIKSGITPLYPPIRQRSFYMTGNMSPPPQPQLKKAIKRRKPSLFIGLRRGKSIIYPITVFLWRKKAQETKA